MSTLVAMAVLVCCGSTVQILRFDMVAVKVRSGKTGSFSNFSGKMLYHYQ